MKTITAMVDVGTLNGTYRKVTIEAESLEDALTRLEAEYGVGMVYSVAEPIETFRP